MPARDWKSIVQKADRQWSKDAPHPPAYEFSNGRTFKVTERPNQPYSWVGTNTGS